MQNKELLISGLYELNLPYTEEKISQLMSLMSELKKWNKAYSLTSIKDDEDIIVRHFLDSCLYLNALPAETTSMADVGSGGGFPALPLKILRPELVVFSIEPTGKKARFQRMVAKRLGINYGFEVINLRVEEVEGLKVDTAVTRALFSAKDFLANTGHIVREDGLLILSKGPGARDEIKELNAAKIKYKTSKATLPHLKATRTIITIENSQ